LTLAAGDKAIYPGLGPCRISRIEKRLVDARVQMFYHFIALDGSRGELFIPVEKTGAIGVRLMIKKSEIPEVFSNLQSRAQIADNWKQRASDNSKLFASGTPFDLAKIVASLTELSHTRSLTIGESRTLERAKRLLVCEISEVIGESKPSVEEQIDRALQAGGERQ
jgi:RNA polymerase-interacting CarD/CdnL/TRCF family regulator